MTNEEYYQKLSLTMSIEEIADSTIIMADLTPEEKTQSEKEIREYRFKRLAAMTEKDHIFAEMVRCSIFIRKYVEDKKTYSPDKTFGYFLKEYITATRIKRRNFAKEIGVHYTKLSRLINDKEEPNIDLCYRLEKHSEDIISTELWWKLVIKKQMHTILQDKERRARERAKVKKQDLVAVAV